MITRALILTLGLGLAACTQQHAQWSGVEPAKRNSVELLRLPHDVAFASDMTTLTPGETARLDTFLAQAAIGSADRIALDLPTDAEGRVSSAAESRGRALRAHLRKAGYKVAATPVTHGATPAANAVRVVVERAVVTPPPCPDWRQVAWPNYQNAPSSNFGCANVTALGQMVADPRDLVEGKAFEPSDGETAAKAVRDLRENKVEWPKKSGGSAQSLIEKN